MQTSPEPEIDLTLKRNCSLSPHALIRVLVLLGLLSLGIAAAFAVAGAWLVLPFAGLEVLALAVAFLLYARHAGDYERIRTEGGRVIIEVHDGEQVSRCELDRGSVRIEEYEDAGRYHVALAGGGAGSPVEIGRHMDEARRRELAVTLRRAFRRR